MSVAIPSAFFFRFAIPVMVQPGLPNKRGRLLKLPETARIPQVNLAENDTNFAELRLGWNREGFGVSLEVRGKKMPVSSDVADPTKSDGLQIWLDTRNTQTIHRASRYCHHLCFLPVNGDDPADATGQELAIARARDDRELVAPDQFFVESKIRKDGYTLEAWIPTGSMTGYDPDANPQLGFYYEVQDAELGRQVLTVGEEFPYSQDPSVWSTLELVSE